MLRMREAKEQIYIQGTREGGGGPQEGKERGTRRNRPPIRPHALLRAHHSYTRLTNAGRAEGEGRRGRGRVPGQVGRNHRLKR